MRGSPRRAPETMREVYQRFRNRQWRRNNPEKAAQYRLNAKVRAWEREQAAKQGALL